MKLSFNRQETRANPGLQGYSVLDANVVVRGDIETEGTLRIDGRLEGNVLRAASVVIGSGGSVVGDVHTHELVIGGSVHGNVTVERRVELESTALVVGDIAADAILIHEGGKVRGRLVVRSAGEEADPRPAAPLRLPSPVPVDA